MEADNKAAAQQILECRQQKSTVYTHQRKKFKGMFDRLAEATETIGNGNSEETAGNENEGKAA